MVWVHNIPNLRHLRMLQVVGRTQGMGTAARELNSSQPAVTLAVSAVEDELGVGIFERSGAGSFPTAAGAILLQRLDRFFDILNAALRQAVEDSPPPRRALPNAEWLMTGTQMRALIALSDPRALAATVEQLSISVDALYRATRTLEKSLGARLFDRTPRGPVCNATGSRLALGFKCAADELKLAREEIGLSLGRGRAEIVLGVLPMSSSHEVARAVRNFVANRRGVRVKVVTGEYDTLLDDLSNCRLDIIFGLLRCPDWAKNLTKEELFEDAYCIVTRPGHPLTKLAKVTPDDLVRYDWIVPPEGTPRRRHIEHLFDGLAETPNFNIETRSLAMARALLLSSDLVTVLTRSEIALDVDLGLVRGLACAALSSIPPKGIAMRTNWLPTPAHAEFLDALRRVTVQRDHDLDGGRNVISLVS